MSECLFCRMVQGSIRPDIVLENEHVMAFRDIHPQAKVHVLVIPKQHIPTLDDLPKDAPELAQALLMGIQEVAVKEGLSDAGYRVVANCRGDGGQEVYHLHFHVLGGRRMKWPPG